MIQLICITGVQSEEGIIARISQLKAWELLGGFVT